MQYRSLLRYYGFGKCQQALLVCDDSMEVQGIAKLLDVFLRSLDALGLRVTRRAAGDLLEGLRDRFRAYKKGERITKADALDLRGAMVKLQTTLDAEIQQVGAYTLTPKRIELEKLTGDVSALFAPGVFQWLREIAKYDFEEAGKCIAFERPTAAAFHILRATEDVLRFYYRQMVRQKRIARREWGPILQDLRSRRRTRKHVALHNHLDHIRTSFRNPTQHPEARYDIDEVQDLWSVCVEVVDRMIAALKKENRL